MICLKTLTKTLLRCTEVLFKPSCLVCQSASSHLLCHRCELPPPVYLDQTLRCKFCFERVVFGDICNICKQEPPLSTHSRFLWDYSGNARDFCVALKYKPSLKLITYAADTLCNTILDLFPDSNWDYLLPIPASSSGLKKRGFNHVEILANKLKAGLKLKAAVAGNLLLGSKNRRPQASLSNNGRLTGMKYRYKIRKGAENLLEGKRVLLLDDVATTGATLQSAAMALTRSGVTSVDILTLCRSPTWFIHRVDMSA